jgi:RNA polymerase sigma-70 factor (ECF subfamily)
MTNDVNKGDHEVEETLRRATSVMDRMSKRVDLRAQLLTILRSFLIHSERRERRAFTGLSTIYDQLNPPFRIPNRYSESPFSLTAALVRIDFEDREAVVLSAGLGLSTREAAKMSGCDVGEHTARIDRGLFRLAQLLSDGAETKNRRSDRH